MMECYELLLVHRSHLIALRNLLDLKQADEYTVTHLCLKIAKNCLQKCCELIGYIEPFHVTPDDLRCEVIPCIDEAINDAQDAIIDHPNAEPVVDTMFEDFVDDVEAVLELIGELMLPSGLDTPRQLDISMVCHYYVMIAYRMLEDFDMKKVHAVLEDMRNVFDSMELNYSADEV